MRAITVQERQSDSKKERVYRVIARKRERDIARDSKGKKAMAGAK